MFQYASCMYCTWLLYKLKLHANNTGKIEVGPDSRPDKCRCFYVYNYDYGMFRHHILPYIEISLNHDTVTDTVSRE